MTISCFLFWTTSRTVRWGGGRGWPLDNNWPKWTRRRGHPVHLLLLQEILHLFCYVFSTTPDYCYETISCILYSKPFFTQPCKIFCQFSFLCIMQYMRTLFIYFSLHSPIEMKIHCKKVSDFPVHSWDVSNRTLPFFTVNMLVSRKELYLKRPARVCWRLIYIQKEKKEWGKEGAVSGVSCMTQNRTSTIKI